MGADVQASVLAQLAKISKIELPGLTPSARGNGRAERYHFDVETPAPDSGP